uniref:Uncharacterized protein n=1 Tax=Physcomitrium patens TaxID=3218 RepID=A0A2K1ICK0_PHYPA|nr:hypothetical protein PHYPA_030491 [Physcomitrium patens]
MVSKCLICELKLKPCSVDDIALDFEYSLRSFRLRSVRVGDTQQRVFLLMGALVRGFLCVDCHPACDKFVSLWCFLLHKQLEKTKFCGSVMSNLKPMPSKSHKSLNGMSRTCLMHRFGA